MNWSDLPPLSALRAFEAAARLGGFSAAGRELNVTQAAVSQQVRALERRLGAQLMARSGRGLALTPEGRRLAERLGAGFEIMRGALAELLEAEAARPVRVTLTPSFAAGWLAPRLGAFREAHPDVELMLNPTGDVVDMAAGGFDLAIRYGAGAWAGLDSEPLLASAAAIVAAPALLAARPVAAPADLLALPWVQELGRDEWALWLARHGLSPGDKRDILHVPGNLAAAALRAGQGVGMVARIAVEEDLREGRLVALFEVEDDREGLGYHIVRRPGRMRADVAAFAAWLRREARRDAEGGDALRASGRSAP